MANWRGLTWNHLHELRKKIKQISTIMKWKSNTECVNAQIPHLASTRRVLYVVFRTATSLDVSHVQLLVQDLDLQSVRRKQKILQKLQWELLQEGISPKGGNKMLKGWRLDMFWTHFIKAAIHNFVCLLNFFQMFDLTTKFPGEATVILLGVF